MFPDPRWHGLRIGHACRAALPRRAHHRDLRRDLRDTAAGHRWTAYQGVWPLNWNSSPIRIKYVLDC